MSTVSLDFVLTATNSVNTSSPLRRCNGSSESSRAKTFSSSGDVGFLHVKLREKLQAYESREKKHQLTLISKNPKELITLELKKVVSFSVYKLANCTKCRLTSNLTLQNLQFEQT